MKKIILILMCLLFSSNAVYAGELPQVAAQGAVLIDGDSGRILWGKNEKTPMTMASTTKIMTAIVVLENADMNDMVKISPKAAGAPEVNMNLSAGEEIRLEELLYAMMLKSYNDAAVALAEHVGGSVDGFCAMMTEKAKEIGAEDTVFGSPNGLDSSISFEKHHSTAYDMAFIARYALTKPEFIKIINTPSIEIQGNTGKHYSVTNSNRFLNSYDGAFGVKTGYTNKAGQCFVGAAKRNGITLISTVLASGWGTRGKEQKWKDTLALMNYGFENFENKTVVVKGEKADITKIEHSPVKEIEGAFAESFSALLSEEDLKYIQIQPEQIEQLQAPVHKGDTLGKAKVLLNGEMLGEVPVVAVEGCERYTLKEMLIHMWDMWSSLQYEV